METEGLPGPGERCDEGHGQDEEGEDDDDDDGPGPTAHNLLTALRPVGLVDGPLPRAALA